MTLILAAVTRKKAFILGDSSAVEGDGMAIVVRPKVWYIESHNALVGFTTSFRLGSLLEYKFALPPHPDGMDDHEFMATMVVDTAIDTLERGLFSSRAETGEAKGGEFMIIYHGKIFIIQEDFHCNQFDLPFLAIGAGQDWANGAMVGLQNTDYSTKQKMLIAASASGQFSRSVSAPFHLLSTRNQDGTI